MYTYSDTYTYTETRIGVIDDHFEMFLTCAGVSERDRKKLIQSVEAHELDAVGIYIEDNGYRIAEVEFSIDWNLHNQMLGTYGERFNVDLPGWNNNVSPEAYVSAQRLVEVAKKMKKSVRSWIRVSNTIRNNPQKHRTVCDNLGYSYGSSVSPWKNPPVEQERQVNYLPEAKVTRRTI